MSASLHRFFLFTLVKRYTREKLRLALVLAAILVANAGLVSVMVLNEAARISFQQGNQGMLSGVYHQIIPRSADDSLTKADYAELRRAGFSNLVATVSVRTRLEKPVNSESSASELVLTLNGIDSSALLGLVSGQQTQVNLPNDTLTDWWQPPYNMLMDQGYANRHGLKQGDRLTSPNGEKLPPLQLVDMPTLGRTAVLDISPLSALFNVTQLDALLVISSSAEFEQTGLVAALSEKLKLASISDDSGSQSLGGGFELNLLAMTLLMYVVCLFVVMNALQLLQADRLPFYRVCRQLGVPLSVILTGCIAELLILSSLAALAGVAVGLQLAKLLAPNITELLSGLYGITGDLNAVALIPLAIKTVLISWIGVAVATWLPLRRINYQLSHLESERSPDRASYEWLIAGLVALATCAAFMLVSSGLLLSLIAVGLLILGGMALCIYLLPVVLKQFRDRTNPDRPMLHWGLNHSLRVSSFSRIAFCAFVIAVTANVGMNLMVNSFRTATEQWLEQRLVAQFYVYSDYAADIASHPLLNNADTQVATRKRAIGYLHNDELPIYSLPNEIRYQQAIEDSAGKPIDWSSFSSNQGVLINQQLAYRHGLSPPDQIGIRLPGERQVRNFNVLGIYPDYGNPESQILMPDDVFQAWPFVVTAIGLDSSLATTDLEAMLDETQQPYRIYTKPELIDISMNAFDRTFLITDGLNVVTLLVATFSLVTSLLLFSIEDQPTRALLRSLGVSAGELRNSMLTQYGILCSVAIVLAMPFGLLLSVILIQYVNVQAFQWSYPISFPAATLLGSVLWIVAIVLIALLIPINRLSKSSLAEDIRCLR